MLGLHKHSHVSFFFLKRRVYKADRVTLAPYLRARISLNLYKGTNPGYPFYSLPWVTLATELLYLLVSDT